MSEGNVRGMDCYKNLLDGAPHFELCKAILLGQVRGKGNVWGMGCHTRKNTLDSAPYLEPAH